MSRFETITGRSKRLLVGGGITAMAGAAMLGVGGSVFAQDAATPAAGTEETADAVTVTDRRAEREARYAAFLDALALNLGVADGETVGAAIRTTMKQMIDERLAAGEIDADLAAELKAAIDSGEYPVGLHLPGMGGLGGPGVGRHDPDGDHRRPDKTVDPIDDAADDTLVPATGTPTVVGDTTA